MSDLTSADHDAIWDIMNNFDFERTHQVMDILNWKWYNVPELTEGVPDIHQLRDTARKMLVECASRARKVSGPYYIGSGGFFAYADYEAASNKVLMRLAFELTDWDNYE